MAMDLNTLQQLMGAQGADTTANTVLTNRLAEAKALRGSVPQAEARTGYVDPLSMITSLIQGSKGRKQVAELQPQQEAAMRRVNELGVAKEQYGLSQAADKIRQAQTNKDRTFEAGRTDAGNIQQHRLSQALALKKQRDQSQGNWKNTFDAGRTDAATRLAEQTRQQEVVEKTIGHRKQFWNKKTNEPKQLAENYLGRTVDADTGEPVDTNLYTATDPKKATTGRGKKAVDPMALVGDPDTLSRVLTNKLLGRATGLFDPSSWLGKVGWGMPFSDDEEGPRIQALQADMADVGINSVKSNLEGLGVNPTDKDLAVAFKSIPTENSQPIAWTEWAENTYLPALNKAFDKAIKAGTATKEDKANFTSHVKSSIKQGKQMWAGGGEDPNEAPQTADTSAIDAQIEALERELGGG